MPKLNFDVPHALSVDEAKDRLQRFTEMLQEKFQDQVSGLTQTWNDDSITFGFKTFGIPIQGNIAVQENQLAVDADLPFSAMMFKGKIESQMREHLERMLK